MTERVLEVTEDERETTTRRSVVGRFVLTSGAMANDISQAVRSELAPPGRLRVRLNRGNCLWPAP